MEGKKRTRRGGSDRASQTPKMRKSCDSCALAKRKCDGKSSCSLCLKRASPCVYSERQKSGPKGVKADEDAAGSADTAATTTATATTADPAGRNSPAKRVRVPSPSSKALGPRQKKQQKSATTTVGWLAISASSAKEQQLLATKTGGSAGAAASTGGSASSTVETNVTVSVSAATLPPAPTHSPNSSITPPPRAKPKTAAAAAAAVAAAGKEPRPPHQRQNRSKQKNRERASPASGSAPELPSALSSPDRARAGAGTGAGGMRCPTATPAPSPPRRRTPQFNSTAAEKIARLPPLVPHGENNMRDAVASRHPSVIGLGSGSLGLRRVEEEVGWPFLPAPPLSESTSSGEGSSGLENVSGILASPEDEVLWSCDEFSGDGERGGSRDDHHLGGSSRGGFSDELIAHRDVGKGQLAVPHPRPWSPSMVCGGPDLWPTAFGDGKAHDGHTAGRTVEERGIGSPISAWTPEYCEAGASTLVALTAFGGGKAHDGYTAGRTVQERGVGSPISSWTPEYCEAGASTLVALLSDTECGLPSGARVGGGADEGGGGAVAGGGGDVHPPDKRQFRSWPPTLQQQTHHTFHNHEGVAGASFANNGVLVPPLTPPSSSVDSLCWNHAPGQQRGDVRNFPEAKTVTRPWHTSGISRRSEAGRGRRRALN